MSAKEFVNALHNKKNLDAEDAFKMAMSSKVGDALEDKRKEVPGLGEVGKDPRSRPDAAAARKRCVGMGLLAKDCLESKRRGTAFDVIDLTVATPSPPQTTSQPPGRAETIDLSDRDDAS